MSMNYTKTSGSQAALLEQMAWISFMAVFAEKSHTIEIAADGADAALEQFRERFIEPSVVSVDCHRDCEDLDHE